jgi:hypothetical protein
MQKKSAVAASSMPHADPHDPFAGHTPMMRQRVA